MVKSKKPVFVGLGGNVGDVLSNMAKALDVLDSEPDVELVAVSPVYKTPPWGITDQDWFLNACAKFETSLEPQAFLDKCLEAEESLKRTRSKRWGPRTIDLDILLFGDVMVSYENLTIPHPRMQERQFVLEPLATLDDGLKIGGKSVGELLTGLGEPALEMEYEGTDWVAKFS